MSIQQDRFSKDGSLTIGKKEKKNRNAKGTLNHGDEYSVF